MSSYNNTNKKILVIDDNKELCELICDALNDFGHDTDYVTDTKTLPHETLNSNDLIFLDLCIPDIDGFELIQLLANKNIKSDLILMSGRAMSILGGAEIYAQQHGLNVIGSISKPFRIDEVLNIVDIKDERVVSAL